jgi:hypothetical protein
MMKNNNNSADDKVMEIIYDSEYESEYESEYDEK